MLLNRQQTPTPSKCLEATAQQIACFNARIMYKLPRPLTSPLTSSADLKVLVEVEVAPIFIHLLRLTVSGLLVRARHDARFLVVANALLEEIGLPGQRDRLHEVKGIGGVIVLAISQREQQAISNEFDILLHKRRVHAQQRARQGIGQEFLFDGHGLGDDVLYGLLAGAVFEVREEEAGEVGVQAFVARDELVGEGEAGHETALLEPEDGGERATEENTFYGGEGDEALGEG